MSPVEKAMRRTTPIPAGIERPLDLRMPQLRGAQGADNEKLVVCPDIQPWSNSQYRLLAAALHDLQRQHGLKIVMVSSAVPQEGKTLTVTNLALTLSETYHRQVLLIDADLRRPSLHEVLRAPKSPGLGDVLRAWHWPLPTIRISPWLALLPAGQPDPSPLAQLTSDSMRRVVTEAAEHFDWILLDTPPISVLPDAQHVASVSHGVVLVIAAGATPYQLVERAVSAIGTERILGTVLNFVDTPPVPQKHYGADHAAPPTRP